MAFCIHILMLLAIHTLHYYTHAYIMNGEATQCLYFQKPGGFVEGPGSQIINSQPYLNSREKNN